MSASESSKVFRVVSLFSGCGGMDLGFKGGFEFLGKDFPSHPFEVVWANDIDAAACDTYAANLDLAPVVGDIWEYIDELPTKADVVVGGFPCQDVSLNGKRHGINGKRSGLYRAMVQVVGRLQPKVFVAENVKGLLMEHNRGALAQVMKEFSELGYVVNYELYHAADFGVPQSRERVFIVGTRQDVAPFHHPLPLYGESEWISAKAAVRDLEDIPEKEAPNHIWSRAKKSPEQGNRKLKADRPAQTIRAECHGNIQFHYELDRRISMREAARFQSFPDDFVFQQGLRKTERQVGNAVPPVLAWHIAKAVADTLSGDTDEKGLYRSKNRTSDGIQLPLASVSAF